jgi:methyl-accepting chemotaxis protein
MLPIARIFSRKTPRSEVTGFTITRRLCLMVGLAALAIVLMSFLNAIEMRESLLDDRRMAVRNQVETAQSVIYGMVEAVRSGKLSEGEAKDRAKSALRSMRYGNGEYFFVVDFDGNAVVHAKRELEGTNILNAKDAHGGLYVLEAIRIARAGGGYFSYFVPRAAGTDPQPKLAYSAAIEEWRWELGNGVYIDDLDATLRSRLVSSAIWALGLLTILLIGGWVIAQGLVKPIGKLTEAMSLLAKGDTRIAVPGMTRRDEIGGMARAVEIFKKDMIEADVLRSEQERIKTTAASERRQELDRLADEFETDVGAVIGTVSSSSIELEQFAGSLSETSARAEDLTTLVACESERACANVQSVATATEEMSSSVHEISRQVQQSARIADEAVAQVSLSAKRMGELSKAAGQIGDVVQLISSIAEQTNLLALNAAIEAARAGDAGRGFAVVASEVKALAEQTSKATDEISGQIASVQTATNESAESIGGVSSTINRLSEIASAIAAAVEEQGAATREIARNVQQAASGTRQVTENVSEVQKGALQTRTASSHVLSAAQCLAAESNRLKLQVQHFLTNVRAA